jgi:hypothetical protein
MSSSICTVQYSCMASEQEPDILTELHSASLYVQAIEHVLS